MPALCHVLRSHRAAIAVFALTLGGAAASAGQEMSVQKLLERGDLEQAVARAGSERDNPESTFLAVQALIKADNADRAREEYGRLRQLGAEDWAAIGESGEAMIAGDQNAALDAATRAVAANGENPYAHYQVGLVANRQGNFERAAAAFERSVELKPDLAYAHYYAGIASQRLKHIAKLSEHLETFLRLAPDAPERATVAAILRTLRR